MEGLCKPCSGTLRLHKTSGGNTDLNIRTPLAGYGTVNRPHMVIEEHGQDALGQWRPVGPPYATLMACSIEF